MAALVRVSGLTHAYGAGDDRVLALRHVDLELAAGERVAVMGRSGSGKTTLLNVLAGLETPSGGRVVIAGRDLARATRREREAHRRSVAGYVWQRPEDGLLPGLTALENVLVPMLGGGRPPQERVERAVRLLGAMRLGDRLHDPPAGLTPLETQRLAVAVALANSPRLLLADELTASLDWTAAAELLGDLVAALAEIEAAAAVVTHDPRVARYVDRVLLISDGIALPVPAPAAVR
jgi:ABC-type lipoprotein export system ATPase subunit